jgi:hypothetical protein
MNSERRREIFLPPQGATFVGEHSGDPRTHGGFWIVAEMADGLVTKGDFSLERFQFAQKASLGEKGLGKDSSINNMDELMVILTNGIIPFWVKVIF